jgi:hypothetical protein
VKISSRSLLPPFAEFGTYLRLPLRFSIRRLTLKESLKNKTS